MGARENTLGHLLAEAGYPVGEQQLRRPTSRNRGSGSEPTRQEVFRVYRQIGGVLDEVPYRPGQWDLILGNVAVELDEEQHFNRYRLATLNSYVYRSLPCFPISPYRTYCREHERECVRKASNRRYWSSKSTVEQFGEGDPPGHFGESGSPRWKQRAFYDFLKDLALEIVGTRVARIAVWDTVVVGSKQVTVSDALDRRLSDAAPGIVKLIEVRAGGALAV